MVSIGAGIFALFSLAGGLAPDAITLIACREVMGAGVGLFYSSISTAAITALNPSRASLAGGVVYMCEVGGGRSGSP
jgi:hypothetical protein